MLEIAVFDMSSVVQWTFHESSSDDVILTSTWQFRSDALASSYYVAVMLVKNPMMTS